MSDRQRSLWRRTRAAWAPVVAMGIVPCRRCGELIEPCTPWDLGHPDEAPHAVVGSGPDVVASCRPEHRACNRGAAGSGRGAAARVVGAPRDGRLW